MVKTIYDLLRLLASHGWRQVLRVGLFRILEHPAHPGVRVTVRGKLSARVGRKLLAKILAITEIEEP